MVAVPLYGDKLLAIRVDFMSGTPAEPPQSLQPIRVQGDKKRRKEKKEQVRSYIQELIFVVCASMWKQSERTGFQGGPATILKNTELL